MMTTTEILTGIKNWVTGKLTLKQDVISDLASIRSGAQAGSTAVQPADIVSYFNNASYDSATHRINFYHGQTIKAYIDASPFIVDGMVDDVRIENGYLVIDFNTASGKQDISIPLTDIFNPNNYYTKSETDSQLTQKQTEINDLYARIGYYVCSTDGNVAAKTIAANNYTLGNGGSIKIKMTNANTANNATLNINSTGAKALYYDGERASANNSWEAGETVEVYYDGTSYYTNNVAGGSGTGDGAFDVSVKYPTSGVEGGNTYTLEGALAVLNSNLSASKKKGGMSIKFVQSSDNKYVQYRLMSDTFNTNVANWQGVDDEPIAGSDNLVKSKGIISKYGNYQETEDSDGPLYVLTDSNNRIILLIKKDADIVFGAGVSQQFIDYVQSQINGLPIQEILTFLDGLQSEGKTLTELLYNKADKAEVARKLSTSKAEELYGEYSISDEYLYVLLDNNNKLVAAFKKDADLILGFGVPTQVKVYLQNVLDTDYGYYEEGQDYLYVLLDNNNKVIAYFGTDSNFHVNGEIYSPTIDYLRNALGSPIHKLNIANSDKIAIIGDSYTQSGYSVIGKSYIAKLSLFSDYIYSNFGVSGDIYVGRMNAIREKTPANGIIPLDEQGIKYAMMCCYTNDLSYMSLSDYIKSTKQMALMLVGIGINPIICTEFNAGTSRSNAVKIRNGLKGLAKELNVPFYNIANITDLIYNDRRFASFWVAGHPGTRSNAIESDNYEKYLTALERPMRSLKIFRARKNTYESLDEYMFHSIEDRARLFNEIIVGARDIVDASDVDNFATSSTKINQSEYQKLAKNIAVGFNNVSLLSAILSTEKKDLSSLKLNIIHDSDSLQVMVKDTIAEPYTKCTKLSSFYIVFTNEPAVGDVYRCEEDGRNYTVQGHIIDNINQYHLLCSPLITSWSTTTGTLTKVSGSGDDSIQYTYRERGIQIDTIDDDTLGHWSEVLPEEDGSYNLMGTGIPTNIVDIDRVDILLISSSPYNITDISFEYSGVEKCVHKGKEFVFESNYYSQSAELLPSSTFGTVGELDTNWNVTPTHTYESQHNGNVYPIGCNSKVDVSENQKLSCTIITPSTDTAVLELWCRYFPDIYTDGSGNQITESSYDYSYVIVKVNDIPMKERVNTHWKIVRFPIEVFTNSQLHLEVSSDKGLEICYISLKY